MQTLNIAAYRFVEIADPEGLREPLLARARSLGIKGTVLLAGEGINLVLAGAAAALRDFLAWLGEDPRFAGLALKESWSDAPPFGRLLVKVKPEMISLPPEAKVAGLAQ